MNSQDTTSSGGQLSDAAILKGIIFPGMDIFDSATDQARKIRNQKKNGQIQAQMLATSRDTEPIQMSYHPDGKFRESRDMYLDPLSEPTSPVCEPSSYFPFTPFVSC